MSDTIKPAPPQRNESWALPPVTMFDITADSFAKLIERQKRSVEIKGSHNAVEGWMWHVTLGRFDNDDPTSVSVGKHHVFEAALTYAFAARREQLRKRAQESAELACRLTRLAEELDGLKPIAEAAPDYYGPVFERVEVLGGSEETKA